MENYKKKVYYAHSVSLYNTFQEARDIQLLEQLGFEVVNPNSKETSESYKNFTEKNAFSENPLPYETIFDIVFGRLIRDCDLLAYKALPSGKIGAGVALEIDFANVDLKPIICLPNVSEIAANRLTGAETRAYLRDVGHR